MKTKLALGLSIIGLSAIAAIPPYKPNVFTTNTLARATFVPATGLMSVTNPVQFNSNLLVVGATELRGDATVTQIVSDVRFTSGRITTAGNVASNASGVAIGGTLNVAGGNIPVIIGGGYNLINAGSGNAIFGGRSNIASGDGVAMMGGRLNTGFSDYAGVIVGGIGNESIGDTSAIIGGENNYAGNVDIGIYSSRESTGNESIATGIFAGLSNHVDSINGGAILAGMYNELSGTLNGSVLIGNRLTNTTTSYEIKIGYANNSMAFGKTTVSFGGKPLISFILTNGIAGVTTNYTYFTNGLAFTNIVGDAWVAWP